MRDVQRVISQRGDYSPALYPEAVSVPGSVGYRAPGVVGDMPLLARCVGGELPEVNECALDGGVKSGVPLRSDRRDVGIMFGVKLALCAEERCTAGGESLWRLIA